MLHDIALIVAARPLPERALETKSASAATCTPSRRNQPRRTIADRVRAALMALADGHAELVSHEESAWSSITFAGTRHEVVLAFSGEDAVAAGEDLICALPEHEFQIPGQLVADATVRTVDHRFGAMERLAVTCVLLLLEEG